MGSLRLTSSSATKGHGRPLGAVGSTKCKGLLAGSLYEKLGMTFDEAYDSLDRVPQEELLEFERDFEQSIVAGTKEATVLERREQGLQYRSLVLNRRVDLEQSRIMVSGDLPEGVILHHVSSGGPHEGLSLVASLCEKRADEPLHMVVLGGGGCAVPALCYTVLRPLYPEVKVDVVELSREVCEIARNHFGISALESSSDGRFALHHADAVDFAIGLEPGTVDMLILDIEDGSSGHDGELTAPPEVLTRDETFLRGIAAAVRSGGALAINTIGDEGSYQHLAQNLDRICKGFDFGYSVCVPVPGPAGLRQRFYISCKLNGVRQFRLDEDIIEHLVAYDNRKHWLDRLRGRYWYKL